MSTSPPVVSPVPDASRFDSPLAGIALMVMATFVFAAQDAVTKSLTSALPVGQIVFVRFTAFLAFALAFAARGRHRGGAALGGARASRWCAA